MDAARQNGRIPQMETRTLRRNQMNVFLACLDPSMEKELKGASLHAIMTFYMRNSSARRGRVQAQETECAGWEGGVQKRERETTDRHQWGEGS
ncbi:unnamed protein product [Eretmochelys imbricata]